MSSPLERLQTRREQASDLATGIIDDTQPGLKPSTRRDAIKVLAADILVATMAEEVSTAARQHIDRRVAPSPRQQYADAKYNDPVTGRLSAAAKSAIDRASIQAENAQRADVFREQRAILTRAASARKNRAVHTATASKMPRTTRAKTANMWVTPTGRVTTMAAHRKRSAAARRGGAFLSNTGMLKEAALSALSKYVKPHARKAVSQGVRAAKGGAHRFVNSAAKSGEAKLLDLIGSGLYLPGQRRGGSQRPIRSGGALRRPRANVSRRGGAFLDPKTMLLEAARSALSKHVKPHARKAVKSGATAARAAAHRLVNSLAASGEAALLDRIGSNIRGIDLPRRSGAGASYYEMIRRVGRGVRSPGEKARLQMFRAGVGKTQRSGAGIRLAAPRRARTAAGSTRRM